MSSESELPILGPLPSPPTLTSSSLVTWLLCMGIYSRVGLALVHGCGVLVHSGPEFSLVPAPPHKVLGKGQKYGGHKVLDPKEMLRLCVGPL